MLKFVGKPKEIKLFFERLKSKYGEKATIKEVCKGEAK